MELKSQPLLTLQTTTPTAEAKQETAAFSIHRSKRIPELDGLRGIAIALVLYKHYIDVTVGREMHSFKARLMAYGQLSSSGVDLFFVLSGFLICGILLDSRSSPGYFRTFYVRRFFRIVPIYLVVLSLFYVAFVLRLGSRVSGLHWALDTPMPLGSIPWIYFLTYTQNFWQAAHSSFGIFTLGVTWSLAVEEQFYLLLPVLIRRVTTWLPYLLGILVIIAPILRGVALLVHRGAGTPLAEYVLMPCRADALIIGALCAFAVRREKFFAFLVSHKRLLVFSIGVLAACGIFFRHHLDVYSDFWMATIGYTWLATLFATVLLFAVSQQGSAACGFLRNRFLMDLGTIAYGTYLFHSTILAVCYGLILGHQPVIHTWRDGAVTLLALVTSIALAKLSWTYFEKPVLSLSNAMSLRPSSQRAAPEFAKSVNC